MKKKTIYILLAVLLLSLFGCSNKREIDAQALTVESISINDEYKGVEIKLSLNQKELTIDSDNIKQYGVVYETGDEVAIEQLKLDQDSFVAESDSLSIMIKSINSENYDSTFYFRFYFIYSSEDEDNTVVYSDEILDFNMYDLAQVSDSLFASEIRFLVENEAISNINIEMNMQEYIILNTSLMYDVVLYRVEDNISMTVTPKNGYRFIEGLELLINNEVIQDTTFTVSNQTLSYVFSNPTSSDPESYVDVVVTLNPTAGFWSSSVFDTFEPEERVAITSLNGDSKLDVIIGDSSVTSLEWFYKLFIKYNPEYNAYQVVYTDNATGLISDLTLPDYDYVILAHENCLDENSMNTLSNYSKGLEEELFLVFDGDVSTYTNGTITASFYSLADISKSYITTMNGTETLPIPFRPEFTFGGWSDGQKVVEEFPRYQVKDATLEVTYTAIWDPIVSSEVEMYLENLIPKQLISDINLPSNYSGYSITWESSNIGILNSEGKYTRPYQEASIILSAIIQSGQETITKTYNIEVPGYKTLNGPLASSYIYRDYSLVHDSFFTTLDIINCAFITADSNGTLSGANVLRNVDNYIMPKARENGAWVLFSVAPESKWSDITSSEAGINTFADNIVTMINTYGFDGVDIDWETPTSAESEQFTEMMRVIYTKVKANNPNHLVTAAIAGGKWQPPRYNLEDSQQYMDYINMMTYGMVTNNGYYQNALSASTTFANSTNIVGKTLISCSIEESVAIYNSYGISNSKIIVGVAFYGIKQTRSYDATSQTWSDWENAGSVSYTNISNSYLDNANYTYYFDSNAGVPFIIKTDGTEFISYDDSSSIAIKSNYIIENGLGGMMYWENGLDHTNTLLSAMEEGLK